MISDFDEIDESESRKWYYQNIDGNWVLTTRAELQELFLDGKINHDTKVGWETGPTFDYRDIDAEYFYEFQGMALPADNEEELYRLASESRIKSSTYIWGRNLPTKGIPYSSLRFTDLTFTPEIKQFIEMRNEQLTTVLSGPNNSGKTLLLKLLRRDFGLAANFLACNRFYHLDRLNPATDKTVQYRQLQDNFINQLYQSHQNLEQSDFPLDQLVSRLKNTQRNKLLELCSKLLNMKFQLKQIDPENMLSQYYIDVQGETLAISSTGTRLLMAIIAVCLDDQRSILLIDEPELGLSPHLQAILANYLFDNKLRQEHFPQLKQLFIATHSNLFLDHNNIANNFILTRSGNEVQISRVETMNMFHDLQFNMLGNSLESLYLPAAIIIVEGKTDYKYVKRVFQALLPDKRISVVKAYGEGGAPDKLHIISESFGDLHKSPYCNRIFILLDQRRSVELRRITNQGIPEHQIIILDKNGIEFYYPST